jgi:threonine/homoserine/homoserine lactone efflux protein
MLLAAAIGVLFGFVGSIPVAGPIAVLVLARGLALRFRSGIFIAAGGAIAESVYAFLAFWGFGALLGEYPWVEPISRGAGAVVLLVLGFIFSRPRGEMPVAVAEPKTSTGFRSAMLGFSITAMNPTLIASWAAAVTVLHGGAVAEHSMGASVAFAGGALVGIVGWFAIMLGLIHRFRNRFKPTILNSVRRLMGFALIGFGLWFAVRFVTYVV